MFPTADARDIPCCPVQVMEDGRLTDSQGRVVSFKNALLVMTSNVGSNVIAKGGGQLGFQLGGDSGVDTHYGRIKTLVTEELKVGTAVGKVVFEGASIFRLPHTTMVGTTAGNLSSHARRS